MSEKKMSLFNIFNPEKNKEKLEELKKVLQFNPNYFTEMERIKLKRELESYM
ncbi:MAG: hypothetical protein ACW98X_14775 [Promethearchaeota archaeon]|jgi:hypothetical protein